MSLGRGLCGHHWNFRVPFQVLPTLATRSTNPITIATKNTWKKMPSLYDFDPGFVLEKRKF